MSYQLFQGTITFPPTYVPPEFTTFAVPTDVTFPDGGSEGTPAASSVQQILAVSASERQYFLYNHGANEVRLFFGGDAPTWETDVRTPLRLPAGNYSLISMSMAKMACFGWSIGGSVVTAGVFTV